MKEMLDRAGLKVASVLAEFIEVQALPGTGIGVRSFWEGAADLFNTFTPENRELLIARDEMQTKLDAWHRLRRGQDIDQAEYIAHLRSIGYLVDEPAPFSIESMGVDPEVAAIAGPQLVVPSLNARFLLNAANARWGSLYNALYGTDVLGRPPVTGHFDAKRGAEVIVRAKAFLDETFPLASHSHSDVTSYRVDGGQLFPRLRELERFAGWTGDPSNPSSVLLKHHGLHVELILDRTRPIGRSDPAGLDDLILESALTTIVDLEDSVAAVDAEDKVTTYLNWFGLMRGDLEASVIKNDRIFTRTLNPDRHYKAPDGSELTLPGRSLLLVRNVGHLMTTSALLLSDGSEAPEGILDALVTGLIGMHDLKGFGRYRNSCAGSIYIVKPKMHGPAEAAFTDRLFNSVEDLLKVSRHTIKIGLMDEERRTSANLAACIHALKGRLIFINTGFLDRTGDEVHTSMHAGAMTRKARMRGTPWLSAYEDRNVQIGLRCGLSGRAQIGKGMWTASDRMADMLDQKIGHPRSGANTAWVPSPTAATLHALHYHKVDVFACQKVLTAKSLAPIGSLLSIPLAKDRGLSPKDIREDLDNNVQGILGYVVRWIDQGVGCSKVLDIHDVALMEDRATLRISSQLLANWLLHGVCSADQIDDAFRRMAKKVDSQNSGDPLYRPLSGSDDNNLAYQAARALVFEGAIQPNGYTEPVLHRFRIERKESDRQRHPAR